MTAPATDPIARARGAWARFWYGRVDPISGAALRQGLAFTLLVYVATWARHADEWLTDAGFHPSAAADPVNAPALPLLPGWALPVAGVVFFAALAAFVFGVRRRIACSVVLAGLLWITYADPISAFTLNRLYIISFLILAVAPRPTPDPDGVVREIAWPTRMIQVLLVSHYFASGVCKLVQGDWGTHRDVLWMQLQGFYMTDFAAWLIRALPEWAFLPLQHGALGFELAAPLLFGIRRLRPLAFVGGIAFHVLVAACMYKLVFFSAQMLALYLVFMPPSWLRRVAARL
jgi:hypothetical protein